MKLKKGYDSTIYTDDFYYDLFVGGYLNPEAFLDNKKDIENLNNAIELIKQYELLLMENGICEDA